MDALIYKIPSPSVSEFWTRSRFHLQSTPPRLHPSNWFQMVVSPFPVPILFKSYSTRVFSKHSPSQDHDDDHTENVQELRVPDHWLDDPATAAKESEWLRVALQKWLDEEYCPEPTNVVISQVAASSLNASLRDKRADLGEILLKMAIDLEAVSYQDSFHGAFSSANAAVNLIVERISSS